MLRPKHTPPPTSTCRQTTLFADVEHLDTTRALSCWLSSPWSPCFTRNTSPPASAPPRFGPQIDSLCHNDDHLTSCAAPRRPRSTLPTAHTHTTELQRRNHLISRCSTRSQTTPLAQHVHWPCRCKRVIADLLQRHHLIGFTLAPKRCSEPAYDLLRLDLAPS